MLIKPLILMALLGISGLAAALFGALHNQLSYWVGPDYFHGFKFLQFGISPDLPPRIGAALVGVQASWWMGPLVGFPAFAYGLIAVPGAARYWAAGLRAITLVIVLATLAALGGMALGIWADGSGLLDGHLAVPPGVERADFIRAGVMHDTSYLGGALGAIVAFRAMLRAARQ